MPPGKIRSWFLVFLSVGMASSAQPLSKEAYEAAFNQRANLLLQHVSQYYPHSRPGYPAGSDGKLDDFGKYNYPLFIALLSVNNKGSINQQVVEERMKIFAAKPTFHFNLVGLPRLLYLFPGNAAFKNNELELLKRVWERKDSYNAWTAEGTENHISMSKTSAYLYAQLANEKYGTVFTDAADKMKMMKQWIMRWSKRIFITGTGEFNSAIYQAYNIIGWLNLYDFAKDTAVKKAAHAVLDYYAVEMALHYAQGMSGGSDLRGQNCTRSFTGSYAYLAWLWFDDSPLPLRADNLEVGRSNNEMIQSVHAATSNYRPPLAAVVLAAKKFSSPAMYYGSKPGYVLSPPGLIKQTLYVGKAYLLGAGYFPYSGWGSGNNQVVSWKLISRVDSGEDKSAQFVSGIGVQSPLDKNFSGGNKRSPYDQLVHYKNVLIQLTMLPSNAGSQQQQVNVLFDAWRKDWATDFAKRFPTDSFKLAHNPIHLQQMDLSVNQSSICFANTGKISSIIDQQILFVELEKTWLAIRSLSRDAPANFKLSNGDEMKYVTVSAEAGKLIGFVIEVASKTDYVDFENFRQRIIQYSKLNNHLVDSQHTISYQSLGGDLIEAAYQSNGSFTEPLFDFGYGITKPMLHLAAPPLQQPVWPVGEGHGRLARWRVNGKLVNLQSDWPVYEGPSVSVGKGKLVLKNGGKILYAIDYTHNIPVFTN